MENDIVFQRRSIRKYQEKAIEPEKVERLLRAAMQAPSACNQQPWEFFVVENREKIEALAKVTPYSACAAGAPLVLALAYRTEGLTVPRFAHIDMAAAQQNIWLEATYLGLGGVWLGIAPYEENMKKVEEILAMPAHLKAFSLFALGYPNERKLRSDRFEAERVHYVK